MRPKIDQTRRLTPLLLLVLILTDFKFTPLKAYANEPASPPFQDITLPFRDEWDGLCLKNGRGLKGASGPIGWWARKTGACTGMSLIVGAALTNTTSTPLPTPTVNLPMSDRHLLATQLARMGCRQKVLIPAETSLFSSCTNEPGEYADIASQQNAVKVISELSPAIVDQYLNPETDSRYASLNALKQIYRELKQGRPALLTLGSRKHNLPHTVLVTGIQAIEPPESQHMVVLSAYDSNWNFEGPYWPGTSRVLIPFESDWSLPKTGSMKLMGFRDDGTTSTFDLDEHLNAFPLRDETRGVASREDCCSIIRTHPSVFSEIERRACGIP